MIETRVSIDACDGTRIPAILAEANQGQQDMSALLLHGITTQKNEYGETFKSLAESLADEGCASVRFDFRGHGESDVELEDFAPRTQLIDVLAVADWLEKEHGATRISLFAASFSAPAAVCAAFVLGPRVERLVLLAPVIDMFDTFVTPQTPWGESFFGSERIAAALRCTPLVPDPDFAFGPRFAADLLLIDVKPILRRLSCPVTVMHGDHDGMVPYGVSKQTAKEIDGVSFIGLPKTDHGLAEAGDEDQVTELTQSNYRRAVAAITGDA